ncbi:MAG: 4a-hydroxytetrahydrobiopterin dehydratase [Candidatus Sungbacteria bacterium RIFCSPLOWO2_02_FULL_51_17]|uniref:4a-hydroxytetrahydrobiopterin dehydratase n=1 Tax=Candidatus Sungbacteria bacterium RIFCSPHIGHO2_02_FULL_51_29 TaxID=1802273 RepID=A0A1G2KRM9_9BACT|nr:MAG: 4a-hydroxytetrahydrobiopterin dehydratase [Candidatus Sungbacteria bacterium RIFCSPHIGHO2_01_FULL_51_22]OHA02076.1 MAG: 4a-hydroxytetrahydrobiopterin dehydratase [Candidatus Sungbacteria bacterium RIFCSPHIGHO2_02_FULL_51_29]OHA04612.1 MAG: 4a-hydroxytetrahydrobiopterin dehydratase [Candidatus Sungbacteria bacterium RIFCSPLOWO2_01_FULL_51_34]OHA12299.1 MAG: 4a-hydroxytetrahydrobiopterin dehydratase [Candidatus Sungbacteria bacterium RIFCSPLOWO2_02_FULL_51_17]
MDLLNEKCVPCEGGVPPYTAEDIKVRKHQIDPAWEVVEGKKLRREFHRKDFQGAMAFVNTIADVAERKGHHPDIHIFYSTVVIELWTHAIGGLSLNDFIVAAVIDTL